MRGGGHISGQCVQTLMRCTKAQSSQQDSYLPGRGSRRHSWRMGGNQVGLAFRRVREISVDQTGRIGGKLLVLRLAGQGVVELGVVDDFAQ